MNWNATSDQRKVKIELEAIIRDYVGMVVGALGFTRLFIDNPFTAKALTLFYFAQFYKEIGITQIIFEGDAFQVINLLQSGKAS